MKRRALIIGASYPPESEEHLAGVNIDLNNYRYFLTSPSGGAWVENKELFILQNATKQKIQRMITRLRDEKPDYSFVAFSGHGGAASPDSNYIYSHDDKEMNVRELWIKAPKRTLIIDSCRKQSPFYPIQESSTKIAAMDSYTDIEAKKIIARSIFFDALKKSSIEHFRAYSCKYGETAADSDEYGGLFSSILIKNSLAWAHRNNGVRTLQKTIETIKPLVIAAREDSDEDDGTQTPTFVRDRTKGNTFPFVIGV